MTVDRQCVKVVGMNPQQQRALWAAAFRTLADAIDHNLAPMPTGVDLWTQYVTPLQLLVHADQSAPEPLQIKQYAQHSAITIPTGQPLDLPVSWTIAAKRSPEPEVAAREARDYDWHNQNCVPAAGETIWTRATFPTGVGIDVTPDATTHISTEHIERDPTDG